MCAVGRRVGNLGGVGAVGGFGAEEVGGLEGEFPEVSGSDAYEESVFAPVSTPPLRFFSFGIPPASIPPS